MCLIALDWQPRAQRKLTLISNRDEFYQRPSQAAHFWKESPHIFGGRDQEMGGTWLAISKTGRLAAITNYRQPDKNQYEVSRGAIPVDFLSSSFSAQKWADRFQNQSVDYAGFNALLFDGQDLVYLTNRSERNHQQLPPGLYGLSNHLLDSSWPKVEKAKSALRSHLSTQDPDDLNLKLINSFKDSALAEDHELPDTGVGLELERVLSSMFIRLPNYGTRATTAISIHQNGMIHFAEQNYNENNESELVKHQLTTGPVSV